MNYFAWLFVLIQGQLLDYLIQVPTSSSDDQLCLLAGKILLYYAEIKKVRIRYFFAFNVPNKHFFVYFLFYEIPCNLSFFLKTCAQLVSSSGLKDSLLQMACNPDPVLQSVVVKIILAILENVEDRYVENVFVYLAQTSNVPCYICVVVLGMTLFLLGQSRCLPIFTKLALTEKPGKWLRKLLIFCMG